MDLQKQSVKTFMALSEQQLEKAVNQFLVDNPKVRVKYMATQSSINQQGNAQFLLVLLLEGDAAPAIVAQSLNPVTDAKALKDSILKDITPGEETFDAVINEFKAAVELGHGPMMEVDEGTVRITMKDKSFLVAHKTGKLWVG